MSTIFEKIYNGEQKDVILYETKGVFVINDIQKQAPIHMLIISKYPYKNLQDIPLQDIGIIGEIAEVALYLANKYGVEDNYRLVTNNGELAGQAVFHLHFHFLAGKKLRNIC